MIAHHGVILRGGDLKVIYSYSKNHALPEVVKCLISSVAEHFIRNEKVGSSKLPSGYNFTSLRFLGGVSFACRGID